MVASIPASRIVSVLPGTISAGGTGLDMVGLILTASTQIPLGQVLRFSTLADVGAYFGVTSDEAAKAAVYFAGFDGSFIKPAFLLFAGYPTAARSAFMRGAALGLSLSQVQALSGTLTITTNGTALTSSAINLSGATSLSNAAAIIQAAFTAPPFSLAYDPVSGGILFVTSAQGASSTISYATGSLATPLKLTAATGAVISPGSDVGIPASAMDAITAQTQDFVSFTTLFAASDNDILAFATWNDQQNDRYLYVPWTTNPAAITNSDTTSPAVLIRAAGLSGTACIYAPVASKAVFVLGYAASVDFNRTNGRTVAAFRTQAGRSADVTNATIADNLLANGYSFYGSYATANDAFTWLYNGQVSGPFAWIDSYLNQIWLNNAFQLSLMTLLSVSGQIPFNDDGFEILQAGLLTNIETAVNFGTIRSGVTLTASQIAQANAIAGSDISATLFARGWFLSIQDPGAAVRTARGSPICTFFYVDGGSVQKIVLNSLQVQ